MKVELLEKRIDYTTSIKVLVIEGLSSDWHDLMFLPRMKHIRFRYEEEELIVSLANTEFAQIYSPWISNLSDELENKTEEELVVTFNKSIKGLIGIGLREKSMPLNEAMGLYAELHHLKNLISVFGQEIALSSWHKPSPSNHDFDYDDSCYEIKAIGRAGTSINISSIDQLLAEEGKKLFIKVYRVDTVKQHKEDSLGLLYGEVSAMLNLPNRNLFQEKCAESTFSPYLGPQYMPLKYKFNIIQDVTYFVDQNEFPRLKRGELPKGISKVKYSIDLTTIEPFKVE